MLCGKKTSGVCVGVSHAGQCGCSEESSCRLRTYHRGLCDQSSGAVEAVIFQLAVRTGGEEP